MSPMPPWTATTRPFAPSGYGQTDLSCSGARPCSRQQPCASISAAGGDASGHSARASAGPPANLVVAPWNGCGTRSSTLLRHAVAHLVEQVSSRAGQTIGNRRLGSVRWWALQVEFPFTDDGGRSVSSWSPFLSPFFFPLHLPPGLERDNLPLTPSARLPSSRTTPRRTPAPPKIGRTPARGNVGGDSRKLFGPEGKGRRRGRDSAERQSGDALLTIVVGSLTSSH